jgi:hypothetical protein
VGLNDGFALYRSSHKWWKDVKPEIKELKELKFEHKELAKPEFDYKQILEINPKEIVEGGPGPRVGGDPYEAVRLLAERVDQLSEQLATGRAFIRPEQRPAVGEEPLKRPLPEPPQRKSKPAPRGAPRKKPRKR